MVKLLQTETSQALIHRSQNQGCGSTDRGTGSDAWPDEVRHLREALSTMHGLQLRVAELEEVSITC